MHSWTKHITGAAALLSLRGKQQLKTPMGRNLFVHLRTQIVGAFDSRLVTLRLTLIDYKLCPKTRYSPAKY